MTDERTINEVRETLATIKRLLANGWLEESAPQACPGQLPSILSLGSGSASGAVVPTSEKKPRHSLLALLVTLGQGSPRTDTFTDPAPVI